LQRQKICGRVRLLSTLGVAALVVGSAAAPAAARHPARVVAAASIAAQMRAGAAVAVEGATIQGALRIPPHVSAPVSLTADTFLGPVVDAATTFDTVVSFADDTFRGAVNFADARFGGPAVFTHVHFAGKRPARFDFSTFGGDALFTGAHFRRATFANAEFDRAARFRVTTYLRLADFDGVTFADTADFTGVRVGTARAAGATHFHGAEFQGAAYFGASQLFGPSDFGAVHFNDTADFGAAAFAGPSKATTSFESARFAAGASFENAEFDGDALFDPVVATADLSFDGADIERALSFVMSRLDASTTFAEAELHGLVSFAEASIHRLDLDGAVFNAGATVVLPSAAQLGSIDELRFDPVDVAHIGVGHGTGSDAIREHALALVETAALAGGDGRAANNAQLRRWTLMRHHRRQPWHILDWIVMWGVGGYLVAPWHQVITIGALLLLMTTLRVVLRRKTRQPYNIRPAGAAPAAVANVPATGKTKRWLRGWPQLVWQSFEPSFAALWYLRIRDGRARDQLEAIAYNLVLLVLVLSLANVWPLGHDLIKGIFP
jgi:uncharacterized protein YjbI with pentapeptide repeats